MALPLTQIICHLRNIILYYYSELPFRLFGRFLLHLTWGFNLELGYLPLSVPVTRQYSPHIM